MKEVVISSINYDYMPTSVEGVKVLWVQLDFPAPEDMIINGVVQFKIKGKVVPTKFFVYDIIGTRIVLCCHGQKYPWGFTMNRDINYILGQNHSWNFGSGYPTTTMIY